MANVNNRATYSRPYTPQSVDINNGPQGEEVTPENNTYFSCVLLEDDSQSDIFHFHGGKLTISATGEFDFGTVTTRINLSNDLETSSKWVPLSTTLTTSGTFDLELPACAIRFNITGESASAAVLVVAKEIT